MLCLILRLGVNACKKFMVYFLKLFWHLWKLTSSHFIRKLHMFMFFLQSTHSRSNWWRGGLCEGHEDFYLQPAAPSGIKPQCSHSHPEPERDHFQEHQGHRVAPWEVTHTKHASSDKNRFIGLVLIKNSFQVPPSWSERVCHWRRRRHSSNQTHWGLWKVSSLHGRTGTSRGLHLWQSHPAVLQSMHKKFDSL